MIVNNVNGNDGGKGPLKWTQSGNSSEKLTGELTYGEYTKPFKPVGAPPYTVVISASNGFTVEGIKSPDVMVTFENKGSATEPILTDMRL
jgi:hypothetical protein